MSWLDIRGSVTFFVRPSSSLKVSITTDDKRSSYAAGQQVNYTVTVIDPLTAKPITNRDFYLGLIVTDDS